MIPWNGISQCVSSKEPAGFLLEIRTWGILCGDGGQGSTTATLHLERSLEDVLGDIKQQIAAIEKQYWGGVCLNVGCIPSKALLRNAELAHTFHRDAELFGISGEVTFDYGAAYDRSRTVADGRVKDGSSSGLDRLTGPLERFIRDPHAWTHAFDLALSP